MDIFQLYTTNIIGNTGGGNTPITPDKLKFAEYTINNTDTNFFRPQYVMYDKDNKIWYAIYRGTYALKTFYSTDLINWTNIDITNNGQVSLMPYPSLLNGYVTIGAQSTSSSSQITMLNGNKDGFSIKTLTGYNGGPTNTDGQYVYILTENPNNYGISLFTLNSTGGLMDSFNDTTNVPGNVMEYSYYNATTKEIMQLSTSGTTGSLYLTDSNKTNTKYKVASSDVDYLSTSFSYNNMYFIGGKKSSENTCGYFLSTNLTNWEYFGGYSTPPKFFENKGTIYRIVTNTTDKRTTVSTSNDGVTWDDTELNYLCYAENCCIINDKLTMPVSYKDGVSIENTFIVANCF